jgi:hypothetical protein
LGESHVAKWFLFLADHFNLVEPDKELQKKVNERGQSHDFNVPDKSAVDQRGIRFIWTWMITKIVDSFFDNKR